MKSMLFSLPVIFIVALGLSAPSFSPLNSSVESSAQVSASQRISKEFPLPEVQSIVQVDVWRDSDKKDSQGFNLPPWNAINLNGVGFDKKPAIGERVTVVPLAVDIAPVNLKILAVAEREDPCNESLPHYWEVELERIMQREFFEATAATPNRREDVPFDVCIIYPAVEFARPLKREQLTKSMIPAGITINTVTAAIDLTNDHKPDILTAYYCCDDSRKLPEECDYTCGKIFKKVNKAWELVEKLAPC